jgi:hypothetical protein
MMESKTLSKGQDCEYVNAKFAADLAAGDCVQWDMSGVDGYTVKKATNSTEESLIIGLVDQAQSAGKTGRVVIRGLVQASIVVGSGTAIAAGEYLLPTTTGQLIRGGAHAIGHKFYALEAIASGTATIWVLVK